MRLLTIHVILSLASTLGWLIWQQNMEILFYMVISVRMFYVYMTEPESFGHLDYPSRVYKLYKLLYGPKQRPYARFHNFDSYLSCLGCALVDGIL